MLWCCAVGTDRNRVAVRISCWCVVVLCGGTDRNRVAVRISCWCRQKYKCEREYKQCCCAALNMVTGEGFINKLGENVHRFWKCQSEQFIMEKISSEGH